MQSCLSPIRIRMFKNRKFNFEYKKPDLNKVMLVCFPVSLVKYHKYFQDSPKNSPEFLYRNSNKII